MNGSQRRFIRKRNYELRKSRRVMLHREKLNKHREIAREKGYDEYTLTNDMKLRTLYKTITDFLDDSNFAIKKLEFSLDKKKTRQLCVPKVFSFNENPDQTIAFLRQLYSYLLCKKTYKIDIEHAQCTEIDIAASSVMDTIVESSLNVHRYLDRNIGLSGHLPKEGAVRDILQISGIVDVLGLNDGIQPDYIKKLDKVRNIKSDIISTRVVKFYEKCLDTQGYELTDLGTNYLSEMVGEVVDNCEQHGGPQKDWFVQGHYSLNEEGDGECHITIFNFGNTIYESFTKDCVTETTKEEISAICEKHKSMYNKWWNEETLITLYALQEGVSRKRVDDILDDDFDRGTGTMKLIRHFMSIGRKADGTKPLLSITSGKAHIKFDDTYSVERIDQRNIAFLNRENNVNDLPDERFVKYLRNKFPGTVISMQFYLDRSYIESVLEGE